MIWEVERKEGKSSVEKIKKEGFLGEGIVSNAIDNSTTIEKSPLVLVGMALMM